MGILDFIGLGGSVPSPGSQLALMAHDAAAGANSPSTTVQTFPASAVPSEAATASAAPLPGIMGTIQAFNPANLLQGGGSMFQDTSKDNEIDPDTGLTKGFIRRENNKSLLNTGLLMMAAGMSTSDSARASLMGSIPQAAGSDDRIRNAAMTRLETAKGKLAYAQLAREQAMEDAFRKQLGFGPTATPAAAPAASAAPSPASGIAMPGSLGVNAALAASSAAAPASAPSAAAPPAAATGLGMPGALGVNAALAATAAPTAPQAPTILPSTAPDTLPVPAELARGYRPVPGSGEAAEIMAMGREKGMAEIARRSDELRNRTYNGPAYQVPGTNQVLIPKYQNGQKIGDEPVGAASMTSAVERDASGNSAVVTRDNRGNVTSLQPTELASDRRADKTNDADLSALQPQVADAQKAYGELANGPARLARIDKTIADVQNDRVRLLPGVQGAWNVAENAGLISPGSAAKNAATGNLDALKAEIAAKSAKDNNGARVTDFDQRIGEVSAGVTGGKQQIVESLQRQRAELARQLSDYNENADRISAAADDMNMSKGRRGLYALKRFDIPADPSTGNGSGGSGKGSDGRMGGVTGGITAKDASALPVMASPEDAAKLAPGTLFRTPDGRVFRH